MKKNKVFLALILFLVSCSNNNTSTSVEESISNKPASLDISLDDSQNVEPVSVDVDSESDSALDDSVVSTSTPAPSITSTSVSVPSTSIASTSTSEELEMSSIKEIRQIGAKLATDEVGELVKFKATYLRTITMSRSNEDLMYFADAESYIYMRIPYANYTGYLANRYTMQEYIVTGNVSKVSGVIEIKFNTEIGNRDSVVNCGDNVPTSVNLEAITDIKLKISDMIPDFEAIPLNKKKSGTGKIVTFAGQLIATDRNDANKKTVFSDGESIITVIAGDKKFINADDIGKYYAITGIMNIEVTSPAILHLDNSYIAPTTENGLDESSIDVTNAKLVNPDFLKSKYILSDKYYSPSIAEYMTFYHTNGYIVDNGKYGENSTYHLGIAAENNGKLISDTTSTGIKSVSGLFLMNHYNVDENDLKYSPLTEYFASDTSIDLYFTIHQFLSTDHGWKVFPIESLVEPLNLE